MRNHFVSDLFVILDCSVVFSSYGIFASSFLVFYFYKFDFSNPKHNVNVVMSFSEPIHEVNLFIMSKLIIKKWNYDYT
jgi:hypothetical protein